ncbi:uncharacterized protein LOC132366923 isoform X5 [Balaenoptera ricei]|uniref:uncharacterized protein LOC132366923 isoform X5 n=1 Tax=Balaenoptera ricei TaxID=2746895 RepID=UPI0028BEE051|nr:uncharacterized protein LOC132366923 isoform X5 [Balaenoptera ricei]
MEPRDHCGRQLTPQPPCASLGPTQEFLSLLYGACSRRGGLAGRSWDREIQGFMSERKSLADLAGSCISVDVCSRRPAESGTKKSGAAAAGRLRSRAQAANLIAVTLLWRLPWPGLPSAAPQSGPAATALASQALIAETF